MKPAIFVLCAALMLALLLLAACTKYSIVDAGDWDACFRVPVPISDSTAVWGVHCYKDTVFVDEP